MHGLTMHNYPQQGTTILSRAAGQQVCSELFPTVRTSQPASQPTRLGQPSPFPLSKQSGTARPVRILLGDTRVARLRVVATESNTTILVQQQNNDCSKTGNNPNSSLQIVTNSLIGRAYRLWREIESPTLPPQEMSKALSEPAKLLLLVSFLATAL